MWQLVFANISVKGWVIDPNQHGFTDGPNHALVFPADYAEIVQRYFMASGIKVAMYSKMELSCVLWTFQQMFCLTPLYNHLHSLPYHTYICKSD